MKILYLSRWFPAPPTNGSRLRIFHTLKYLGERHDLHLVSFTDRPILDAHAGILKPWCRSIATVPWREFDPTRAKALAGFFSAQPRSVVDTFSAAMQELARRTADDLRPDVVIASQNGMAPYALHLDAGVRILEELELGLLHTSLEHAQTRRSRVRAQLTWWKSTRYYKHLVDQFDGCTVVSDVERSLAGSEIRTKTPIVVIPNGVEMPEPGAKYPSPEPDTLIYCGSPTFSANLTAVRFFVDEVLPAIARRRPKVVLRVTGELPTDLTHLPQYQGRVIYTGLLPDVRPLLASSWASVIPLREGGGTRLKLLESLAVATPVITTSKGMEGLDLRTGVEVICADDPGAIADATVRLLGDASLREHHARAGREAVAHSYQWKSILADFESFLLESVREKSA